MRIRILDDLHWKEIYDVLKDMLPWYTYPIKKDVLDPLPYLSKIKNWDLILLDNYFNWWEWPLWDSFLWEFLKTNLGTFKYILSDRTNYAVNETQYKFELTLRSNSFFN